MKKQESICGIQTIQKIEVHLNNFTLVSAFLNLKEYEIIQTGLKSVYISLLITSGLSGLFLLFLE